MTKSAFNWQEPTEEVAAKPPGSEAKSAGARQQILSRVASGEKIGFAALTPERRKQIASLGGKAAHREGRAYEFDSETGRRASLLRKNIKKA